jgi:DNA helicase-2/ATP-dependent DNA helicase PcrA
VRYYADLHIHSKYSRACSRDCDLEHLAWWARRKGITLLGTGDFTHPAWAEEIATKLVPAEPGLFKLRDDLDAEVLRTLPAHCRTPVRFVLEVEISTIYKRDDRTRKVHHLCYVPDLAAAEKFTASLARIGNLGSDGRPILGLDSRDLLEITLESGPDAFLIPAHVWTPWFAVLGSKSGFDAVADGYVDLAEHIFAVETGLSSDPSMNWRVSGLDSYRLVANSDAHSPPALGRNATLLAGELGYPQLKAALATGEGYVGTVDMFPEEGKYHHDGHRNCDVRFTPAETRAHGGRCPECGKPLTVGVQYRVEELADQPAGRKPATAGEFHNIVPLPEIVGEILGVGPKSKKVQAEVDRLVGLLGSELDILLELPLDRIAEARSELLTEAITRLRDGRVSREAGYDGEYGVISLFDQAELAADGLFGLDLPTPPVRRKPKPAPQPAPVPPPEPTPAPKPAPQPGSPLLAALDSDQRAAAELVDGPLLIVAGPGTGKTRTLTHRLAHLVTDHEVAPEHCLAITFTRRACGELRDRLDALLGQETAARLTVATFHGLGLRIIREQHARLGLPAEVGVADETTRLAILTEITGGTGVKRALETIGADKRERAAGRPVTDAGLLERYDKELRAQGLLDFDDLVTVPVALLAQDDEVAAHYRDVFRRICVDEYQDVDETQYRLLRLLAPADGHLCAIGDPDQAIYSFRGADVGFFLSFRQDFPGARVVSLTRNYRSSPVIVAGAVAAITPGTLVPARALHALRTGPAAERIAVHQAADPDAEARHVVTGIEELIGGSSFHARDSGRARSHGAEGGLSFDDIAVLYRTDAQARPVMAALAAAGLPYQKRSHNRLASHDGVRALLAALPVESTGEPLELLLRERITDEPTGEAVELLKPFARQYGADIPGFRAELALGAEVDTWDPRANRISLLTLHAAKGLEFPVVFLIGCADGLLPMRFGGADEDVNVAEERRLFFVGVSRAQAHLHLSHSAQRLRHGKLVPAQPSPFLATLTEELADRTQDNATRVSARTQQLRLL